MELWLCQGFQHGELDETVEREGGLEHVAGPAQPTGVIA